MRISKFDENHFIILTSLFLIFLQIYLHIYNDAAGWAKPQDSSGVGFLRIFVCVPVLSLIISIALIYPNKLDNELILAVAYIIICLSNALILILDSITIQGLLPYITTSMVLYLSVLFSPKLKFWKVTVITWTSVVVTVAIYYLHKLNDIALNDNYEHVFDYSIFSLLIAIAIMWILSMQWNHSKYVLKSINTQITQKNKWLESFSHFLGHELKNKIRGTEGAIDILQNKVNATGEDVFKYCNRAKKQITKMKDIIDNTVQSSDLEHSIKPTEFKSLNLDNYLKTYVNETHYKNVSYNKTYPVVHSPWIKADESVFDQMLSKIVDNAVQFRDEGSTIYITLGRDTEYWKIDVLNEGSLLPVNTENIFELDYTKRSDQGGDDIHYGFGLFVANRIAQYHRGHIAAENNNSNSVIFSIYIR